MRRDAALGVFCETSIVSTFRSVGNVATYSAVLAIAALVLVRAGVEVERPRLAVEHRERDYLDATARALVERYGDNAPRLDAAASREPGIVE